MRKNLTIILKGMGGVARICLLASLLLCLLVFPAVTGHAAEPPDSRATAPPLASEPLPPQKSKVLVIYSFSGQTPWERTVRDAFYKQLDELSASRRLEIFEERLDLIRLTNPEANDYLSDKYRSVTFNAVVAEGGAACNFLSKRPSLFPGAARYLFTNRTPGAPPPAGTTVYGADLDGNLVIKTIIAVLPDVRRIILVADKTPNRDFFIKSLMDTAARYTHKVAIELWDDLSVAELYEKAADLTGESAILYAGIFRDRLGEPQIPALVGGQLSRAASVPVFGVTDSFMVDNVLGGYLVSAEKEGRLIARVIAEQGGQPPQLTPDQLTAALNGYLFDDRQLKLWGIPDQRLPTGSVIVNRKTTLWDQYRWRIIGVVALCVVQSILIIAMLTQRSLRRRAEAQLQRQKDELAHLTRVNLMGELSASFAHELKQPLAAIRINIQTARSMLEEGSNLPEIREILDDINADNRRADEIIRRLRAFFTKGEGERTRIDLNHLIREMSSMVASEARANGVIVKLRLAPSLPAIMGDPIQIQQVLLNLIMNALESLRSGEHAEKRITVSSEQQGNGTVRVEVADTGPGIPDGRHEEIFSSFQTTKPGGMGMGLTISRAIIEAHDGRLVAEPAAAAAQGAVFAFSLPIPQGNVHE